MNLIQDLQFALNSNKNRDVENKNRDVENEILEK